VVSEFLKHVNGMSEELRRSGPGESRQKRAAWGIKEYAQQVEASLKDQAGDLHRLLQGAEDIGLVVSVQYGVPHSVSSIQPDSISYVISSISNSNGPVLYLHMRR
jgi:hypothetical protein